MSPKITCITSMTVMSRPAPTRGPGMTVGVGPATRHSHRRARRGRSPHAMQRDSAPGPAWTRIREMPRARVPEIEIRSVPDSPGVYAWFKSSEPIYAGKASGGGGLRERVGKHLEFGPDLSRSSLRRNVAEHVLNVPTSVSRQRPSVMTSDQVSQINEWIRELEVTWLEFPTPGEAVAFERELLREWMPPLSKR
jgi:hypothetical protein